MWTHSAPRRKSLAARRTLAEGSRHSCRGRPEAFDVEFAVYLFGGAFLSALPDVADRRDPVRDALLAGYRSTAPGLADAVATRRPIFELRGAIRVMNDFDRLPPGLPEGTVGAVAAGIRSDVDSLLDGDGR